MRGRARIITAIFALGASACGKETRFIAAEMSSDADVRVVLAIASSGQKKIEALAKNEPFIFPLQDAFSAGARVKVFVFAFSAASLTAQFPALAGRSAEEIRDQIRPDFGTAAAGAYDYPDPMRILGAELDADSSANIVYRELQRAELDGDPDAAFVLKPIAGVACAPGENAFRAFNRSNPGLVCLFDRSASCTWELKGAACANLTTVFDRSFGAAPDIREVPPETLRFDPGDVSCAKSDDLERGESRSWRCPGAVGPTSSSIQDTPKAAGGGAWKPTISSSAMLNNTGHYTHVSRGSIYAFRTGSLVTLRRFEAKDDSIQSYEIVKVIGTSSWGTIYIPGDAQPNEVSIGAVQRVSSNGSDSDEDQVVVDGDMGTYVLIGNHGISSSINALSFYKEPIPLEPMVLPLARRVGHVISGPSATIYALTTAGVAVLRVDGDRIAPSGAGETSDPGISFSRGQSPQIAAVKKGTEERAIVWLADGSVYAFDNDAVPRIRTCHVDGDILTAIDGPRLLRRPSNELFVLELIDLARAEAGTPCDDPSLVTRYLVPPNNEDATGRLELDPSSFARVNDREMIAYRYGAWAGVLDLRSGLSQAVDLGTAALRGVLFESYARNELWAMFALVAGDRHPQLRVPMIDVQ